MVPLLYQCAAPSVQVVTMLFTTFLFKALSIKAARALHNSMVARLLRCIAVFVAPMRCHLLDCLPEALSPFWLHLPAAATNCASALASGYLAHLPCLHRAALGCQTLPHSAACTMPPFCQQQAAVRVSAAHAWLVVRRALKHAVL